MPPGGTDYFARPEKGGLKRDPATIFSHRMPGAMDQELLQNAITMTATARLEGNAVVVQVTITNDKTGHHVPTGSPLRHLILLVQATDGRGSTLPLQDGPALPDWAGPQSGRPGKIFAKVLEELWTEISPSGAYWNPTRLLSDNRLAAFAADTSTYTFAAPQTGAAAIEVTLIYRRAFIKLMEQKGWDVPDIIMAQENITLNP